MGARASVELRDAARAGNVELVDGALKRGGKPSCGFKNGNTALHWASHRGHTAVVERLLAAKAKVSVDAKNKYGRVPLVCAAQNGHVECLERLLDAGANPRMPAADQNGRTALHSAIRNRHVESARLLLRRGADATAVAKKGWTPLHCAAREGLADLIPLLLEHGAPLEALDHHSSTALYYAAFKGHLECVEILLRAGANGNAVGRNGFSVLQGAIVAGKRDTAEALICWGANLAYKHRAGRSAYGLAVHWRRPECITLLEDTDRWETLAHRCLQAVKLNTELAVQARDTTHFRVCYGATSEVVEEGRADGELESNPIRPAEGQSRPTDLSEEDVGEARDGDDGPCEVMSRASADALQQHRLPSFPPSHK